MFDTGKPGHTRLGFILWLLLGLAGGFLTFAVDNWLLPWMSEWLTSLPPVFVVVALVTLMGLGLKFGDNPKVVGFVVGFVGVLMLSGSLQLVGVL